MNKIMWKVSGLVFVTSSLVGLIGGLVAGPRSGARTRIKMRKAFRGTKEQVTHKVHDFKGSVANMTKQGNTSRKNWLSLKGLTEWQQGFLEFPRLAPAKIIHWEPKDVQ